MDKYVIKKARSPPPNPIKKNILPKQKQTTIESLARVVVVEEIKQAKSILSIPNQRTDQIITCLRNLSKRTPSKEVLLETKIGHVINKLRRHENEEVKSLARNILKSWKQFYRDIKQRQPIEVRCDKQTETFRKKAKTLIAQALGLDASSNTVEIIERAVYLHHNRNINFAYKRMIRSMHFKVKSNNELRSKIINNDITAKELCETINSQ